MNEIRSILVPVDFSPCSAAAADHAAAMALRVGASVDLLHVLEPVVAPELVLPLPSNDRTLSDFAKSSAGDRMRDLLASLEATGVDVRGRLESGDPCETILRLAASYELVVMGTHGRTGIVHWLLGGVAEKVVQRAPCPVLTVRAGHRIARPQRTSANGRVSDPEFRTSQR